MYGHIRPEAYLNPDMPRPYAQPLQRSEKKLARDDQMFTCLLSGKEKMLNIDTLGLYYKKTL